MPNLKILEIKDTCTACSACYNVCPRNAIQIKENDEGFYYPFVSPDLCINCKLCEKTCPVINAQDEKSEFSAFYGYSTSNQIINSSSSGGAFYALASDFLNSGGVIFGAVFNYGESFRLEHRSTRDFPISALMKSKYVQSYIGDSFKQIKELLEQGTKVMFVGTPCQVNGLSSFLKKEYENLLKVDFICHGVPSMDMFKKHLSHIGFDDYSKISRVDFRPKIFAWVDYLIVETNRKKYKRHYHFDEYFNNFQANRTLRLSCMSCLSCNGKNRSSDITLADFWGYRNAGVRISGNVKGVSLILAGTEKGNCFVNRICSDSFKIFKLDESHAEYVFARNRDDNGSRYNISERNLLIRSVYDIGYSQTMKKFGITPEWHEVFVFNLKTKIKKLIGRL